MWSTLNDIQTTDGLNLKISMKFSPSPPLTHMLLSYFYMGKMRPSTIMPLYYQKSSVAYQWREVPM